MTTSNEAYITRKAGRNKYTAFEQEIIDIKAAGGINEYKKLYAAHRTRQAGKYTYWTDNLARRYITSQQSGRLNTDTENGMPLPEAYELLNDIHEHRNFFKFTAANFMTSQNPSDEDPGPDVDVSQKAEFFNRLSRMEDTVQNYIKEATRAEAETAGVVMEKRVKRHKPNGIVEQVLEAAESSSNNVKDF